MALDGLFLFVFGSSGSEEEEILLLHSQPLSDESIQQRGADKQVRIETLEEINERLDTGRKLGGAPVVATTELVEQIILVAN